MDKQPYSQSSILWRFLSAPVRYLLREKCLKKVEEICAAKKEIERCSVSSRRSGKTMMNMSLFFHNQHIIHKAENFLMWWS